MPTPRFDLEIPAIYSDPEFIERLTRAGAVLAMAMNAAAQSVAPGVRPIDLAETLERELLALGAIPILKGYRVANTEPFPAAAAVCVNEVAVNGVPGDQPLSHGDILTIDSACSYEGAVCDMAVSVVVGGGDDPLLRAAKSAHERACAAIVPGCPLSEIALAARDSANALGYELLDEAIAHGTGLALHQPPAVFLSRAERGELIQSGMVLAVEPVVVERSSDRSAGGLRTLADGWSRAGAGRSAYEERTVLVTEKGVIELTLGVAAGS